MRSLTWDQVHARRVARSHLDLPADRDLLAQVARFIPEPARARIASFGRGRFEGPVAVPLVVVNGTVVGMWQQKKRGRELAVTVETFTKLPRSASAEVELQVLRLGDFYQRRATVAFGPLP